MAGRPLLLLDVDGVLNPFPEAPRGYEEHAFFPEEDEPVRLARVHGGWICELAGIFDVAWATGWGDEANRVLAPFFGVGPFSVVPMPAIPFDPRERVPAVAAYAAGRTAAWVDDMLGNEARAWAETRREPTLLVEVESAVGLTRDSVDELLAWAAEL